MTSPLTAVGEERLREILAGCEGVTPGKWRVEQMHSSLTVKAARLSVAIVSRFDQANAAHIARLDPDTVKELCRLALIGLKARRSPVPEGDGLRVKAWPKSRVNVPYPGDPENKRVVGFVIEKGDLIYGEYGLSEPLAWLDRMLASPAPVKAEAEVVAWAYELATRIESAGSPNPTYSGWDTTPRLSLSKPHVPEGSIRNLRPLYATPSSGGRREALLEAEAIAVENAEQCDRAFKGLTALNAAAYMHGRAQWCLAQIRALANTNPTGAE